MLHSDFLDNLDFKEIQMRLQVIDKEIIRLIEAKKRYEIELQKMMDEAHNENQSK